MQTVITYLHTFAQVLVYLYIFAIFARAAASWFVRDFRSALMSFLVDVTEPLLAPLRRLMPSRMGIDFSPMVAIVVLYVLGQFLA
ncbi:MAG: YggT family protein [Candidatus Dormibacteria bacterium]